MIKIFGIGLPKTGTTSLGKAFDILGYKHKNTDAFRLYRDMSLGKYKSIMEEISKYDAFEDNPWCSWYKWLYPIFTDAKFIYTERNVDEIYESMKANAFKPAKYNQRMFYIRTCCYGRPFIKEASSNKIYFTDQMKKHRDEVFDFFKHKNNFLSIKITSGEGWEKLCPFLQKEIPGQPFPHKNITK